MSFGKRLRTLRVKKGLTQKQLAEPRYTHAYVSTIEAGRRKPSRDAAEYFANKLEVDFDELLTGRPADLDLRLRLELQEVRVLVSAGTHPEAETRLAKIEAEARKFHLKHVHYQAVRLRGLNFERQADLHRAIDLYEQAEAILEDEPPNLAVEALVGRARCLQILGDNRLASHILEGALTTLQQRRLTDPSALARINASLAFDYSLSGLHEKANEAAMTALDLIPQVVDPEQMANMYMNVAHVLSKENSYDAASDALRRAEELFGRLELRVELGRAHIARGMVLGKQGKLDEALAHFERAANEMKGSEGTIDEARLLNEIAHVHRLRGEFDIARPMLERSAKILEGNEVAERAFAYRETALCIASDDQGKALKLLEKALALYRKSEEAEQVAMTYREIGDLQRSRGDVEKSLDAYRAGLVAVEPGI